MLSGTLVPRDESHPHMLDRAAAYIRREFEQAGGTVSEQPYDFDGKTYRNVIALFGPDTGERIVVGAHYDSVAADVPAADDNASGVAGVIELAYWLGATSPRMQIELVAYTLEGEASLRFFNPSGLFSNVDVIYTDQKAVVSFLPTSSHQNEFVTVNAGLGYRLPKRHGLLGMELRNLFDEEFAFQDFGLRSATDGETTRFFPERAIFARFTFAF